MAEELARGQRRLFLGDAEGIDERAPSAPDGSRPAVLAPEARSVSDVVRSIAEVLDDAPELRDVWVRGEISGFRPYAGSGHWYFNLKDEKAVLRAVMWRGATARVPFAPADGVAVLARGRIAVYEGRGDLQIQVSEMRPEGAGTLAQQLEALRRRLEAEGLFDPARKRPLPRFAWRIGVVTSREGAVWHDIQRVARRRFPGARLLLAPVKVQGEGAAQEVAAAVARFNRFAAADVLIVGRGGGSLEDLWAFNEEPVVRAIAASRIPVVSAVGHETDFTLADFAADRRAATPSQAAELVTPEIATLVEGLVEVERRLAHALERRVPEARQRADEALARLALAARLALNGKAHLLAEAAGTLEALSPLGVLARGYAVAQTPEGTPLRARAARPGDAFRLVLHDGEVEGRVERARPKEGSQDG